MEAENENEKDSWTEKEGDQYFWIENAQAGNALPEDAQIAADKGVAAEDDEFLAENRLYLHSVLDTFDSKFNLCCNAFKSDCLDLSMASVPEPKQPRARTDAPNSPGSDLDLPTNNLTKMFMAPRSQRVNQGRLQADPISPIELQGAWSERKESRFLLMPRPEGDVDERIDEDQKDFYSNWLNFRLWPEIIDKSEVTKNVREEYKLSFQNFFSSPAPDLSEKDNLSPREESKVAINEQNGPLMKFEIVENYPSMLSRSGSVEKWLKHHHKAAKERPPSEIYTTKMLPLEVQSTFQIEQGVFQSTMKPNVLPMKNYRSYSRGNDLGKELKTFSSPQLSLSKTYSPFVQVNTEEAATAQKGVSNVFLGEYDATGGDLSKDPPGKAGNKRVKKGEHSTRDRGTKVDSELSPVVKNIYRYVECHRTKHIPSATLKRIVQKFSKPSLQVQDSMIGRAYLRDKTTRMAVDNYIWKKRVRELKKLLKMSYKNEKESKENTKTSKDDTKSTDKSKKPKTKNLERKHYSLYKHNNNGASNSVANKIIVSMQGDEEMSKEYKKMCDRCIASMRKHRRKHLRHEGILCDDRRITFKSDSPEKLDGRSKRTALKPASETKDFSSGAEDKNLPLAMKKSLGDKRRLKPGKDERQPGEGEDEDERFSLGSSLIDNLSTVFLLKKRGGEQMVFQKMTDDAEANEEVSKLRTRLQKGQKSNQTLEARNDEKGGTHLSGTSAASSQESGLRGLPSGGKLAGMPTCERSNKKRSSMTQKPQKDSRERPRNKNNLRYASKESDSEHEISETSPPKKTTKVKRKKKDRHRYTLPPWDRNNKADKQTITEAPSREKGSNETNAERRRVRLDKDAHTNLANDGREEARRPILPTKTSVAPLKHPERGEHNWQGLAPKHLEPDSGNNICSGRKPTGGEEGTPNERSRLNTSIRTKKNEQNAKKVLEEISVPSPQMGKNNGTSRADANNLVLEFSPHEVPAGNPVGEKLSALQRTENFHWKMSGKKGGVYNFGEEPQSDEGGQDTVPPTPALLSGKGLPADYNPFPLSDSGVAKLLPLTNISLDLKIPNDNDISKDIFNMSKCVLDSHNENKKGKINSSKNGKPISLQNSKGDHERNRLDPNSFQDGKTSRLSFDRESGSSSFVQSRKLKCPHKKYKFNVFNNSYISNESLNEYKDISSSLSTLDSECSENDDSLANDKSVSNTSLPLHWKCYRKEGNTAILVKAGDEEIARNSFYPKLDDSKDSKESDDVYAELSLPPEVEKVLTEGEDLEDSMSIKSDSNKSIPTKIVPCKSISNKNMSEKSMSDKSMPNMCSLSSPPYLDEPKDDNSKHTFQARVSGMAIRLEFSELKETKECVEITLSKHQDRPVSLNMKKGPDTSEKCTRCEAKPGAAGSLRSISRLWQNFRKGIHWSRAPSPNENSASARTYPKLPFWRVPRPTPEVEPVTENNSGAERVARFDVIPPSTSIQTEQDRQNDNQADGGEPTRSKAKMESKRKEQIDSQGDLARESHGQSTTRNFTRALRSRWSTRRRAT